MSEKGQKRLDSVAYLASRSCVGLETSPAPKKSALGTVGSTQGAVLAVGREQPTGCILPEAVWELKSNSGRAKDSSGAALSNR